MQEVLELDSNTQATAGKMTPKNLSLVALTPVDEVEEELRPGEMAEQRQKQKLKDLYLEAQLFLEHYNKKTLTALIKSTRHTLETIKRRLTSPSTIQYGDSAEDRKRLDHRPAIVLKLTLAIPHVGLKPALEELQTCLNSTIQSILAVHKGIIQWRQVRNAPFSDLTTGGQSGVLNAASKVMAGTASGVMGTSSAVLGTQSAVLGTQSGVLNATSVVLSTQRSVELRSFYKAVKDHKEVAKLVSLMTSTFTSAKVLVTQTLEHFKKYEDLWSVDRDKAIEEFMKEEPTLSDFEAKMKEYTALDEVISEEEDLMTCGSLALMTGT